MAQYSSFNRQKGAGWLLLVILKALIDNSGGTVSRELGLAIKFGIVLKAICKKEHPKEIPAIEEYTEALQHLQDRYDPLIEDDHADDPRSVFEMQIDEQLVDLLSIAFSHELIDPNNMPTGELSAIGSVTKNDT